MEYSDSGNLEQLVQANGGIDESEAVLYFKQIMSAISYIHERGVAHRDVTLKNILVSANGSAKLSDFGLCKHQPENSYLTTTCGTFVYVPPEILEEQMYDGLKADIWSAGICLYAMTCNHLPWTVDDSIPPEKVWEETQNQICSGEIQYDDKQCELLRDLLSQMLQVNPEFRPDADEILAHPWLAGAADYQLPDVPEPDANLINLVNSLINNLDK
ncbi:CAMK family protein kinase [Trichomonas vaginalis G3]|uniref:CAMK family protein kinase n=1 Tax=Trichomonas vaginalis (strain ATCC PRA-98 / G3) TaxID=412133 RepID=A2ET25_TRIV3|nr:protein serine/threonine kinase protein [Trichomonas vaginalis G3]EAY04214.1 CAMK family protein kinase [Trichomonas vaginalis G3]KAI5493088.1 protein serine/threonine kinase protein [Trichomonas vaginalis G3]|eukprot:XP_001316437.1 CAMK family protein kinase [Trichomonas vaginalis G3]